MQSFFMRTTKTLIRLCGCVFVVRSCQKVRILQLRSFSTITKAVKQTGFKMTEIYLVLWLRGMRMPTVFLSEETIKHIVTVYKQYPMENTHYLCLRPKKTLLKLSMFTVSIPM